MKYLIQCGACGTILFKTEELIVRTLISKIKCPNPKCKKVLNLPEDTIVSAEQKRGKKLAENH